MDESLKISTKKGLISLQLDHELFINRLFCLEIKPAVTAGACEDVLEVYIFQLFLKFSPLFGQKNKVASLLFSHLKYD